jgi:hypothetical protein
VAGEVFEHKEMQGSVFKEANLNNSRFDLTSITGATFNMVNMPDSIYSNTSLNNSVFKCSNLDNAVITDTFLRNMKISFCLYDGLTIDGIEVLPLVEAEKDRLDPERIRLRIINPFDPDEVKKVMHHLDEVRDGFYAFLRSTPHELLIKKPKGIDRWSALEHVRHLLFAEDLYLNHRLLNNNIPYNPIGMIPDFLKNDPSFNEVGSKPTEDLEEVLSAWSRIHEEMIKYIKMLTPELLKSELDMNPGGREKITVGYIIQMLPPHDLLHIRMAEKAIEEVKGWNAL